MTAADQIRGLQDNERLSRAVDALLAEPEQGNA
jgi:hypothetical protein